MTFPLIFAGASAILYGMAFVRLLTGGSEKPVASAGAAFDIKTAVPLAGTLAVVLFLAAVLRAWLGDLGIDAGCRCRWLGRRACGSCFGCGADGGRNLGAA